MFFLSLKLILILQKGKLSWKDGKVGYKTEDLLICMVQKRPKDREIKEKD